MTTYPQDVNANIQEVIQRLSRLETVVSEQNRIINTQKFQINNLQEDVKQLRQICSPITLLKQEDYQQIKLTEDCIAVALDRRTKDITRVFVRKGDQFGLIGQKIEQGWTEVISDAHPYKILKIPTAYSFQLDLKKPSEDNFSLSVVQNGIQSQENNLQPVNSNIQAQILQNIEYRPNIANANKNDQKSGLQELSYQPSIDQKASQQYYTSQAIQSTYNQRPNLQNIQGAYIEALFEDSEGKSSQYHQVPIRASQNIIKEFLLLKQQPSGRREERIFYVYEGNLCWKTPGDPVKTGALPFNQIETASIKDDRLIIRTVGQRYLQIHGNQNLLQQLLQLIKQ